MMKTMGFASLYPSYALYWSHLTRKTLAPRWTLERHQSASNQPEVISMVLSAVDPGLGGYGRFFIRLGSGKRQ
jgi:hypothetical protein